MRLLQAVNDRFGTTLEVADLYRTPTVTALARAIAVYPEGDKRCASLLGATARTYLTIDEKLHDRGWAMMLAQRANEISGFSVADQLDALALVHHRTGDSPQAVELQRKAISFLRPEHPERGEYEARLTEYETAVRSIPPRE